MRRSTLVGHVTYGKMLELRVVEVVKWNAGYHILGEFVKETEVVTENIGIVRWNGKEWVCFLSTSPTVLNEWNGVIHLEVYDEEALSEDYMLLHIQRQLFWQKYKPR